MWYKVKKIYMRQNGVEKQVRPATWNPWSNTIAYYPLTSTTTVNDMSGNNYNLTNTWWVTFVSYQWVNCAYYAGTWFLKNTSLSYDKRAFTMQWWWYYLRKNANNTSFIRRWPNLWAYIDRDTNNLRCSPWWIWWTVISSDSWWNLITVTYDWNVTMKLYLNWTLIWTKTDTSPSTWWWLSVWNANINSTTDYWYWWISEVIIENKVWTATEVSNYYNLTKSKYWL